MPKMYLNKTVDVALRERIEWIFDRFETVVVSISGGKDSTVLFDAARKEAERRGRQIHAFFLDQEAEYQATIEHIRHLMAQPSVVPLWYQVPIRMANATSYDEPFLHAWGPGEDWVREREPNSIHEATGAPDRFMKFFDWFEAQYDAATTGFLVGLRAEESLNRYRTVVSYPAIPDVPWSSWGGTKAIKLYPLYDFTFEDIWTYLGKFKVPYNKAYDRMWIKGFGIHSMRVSNLIHEKAYQCLATLQEFEPETWEKLQSRISGVHAAGIYAKSSTVYSLRARPPAFKTWKAYRDFLLETFPGDKLEVFRARFAGQEQNESVFRQQCQQLALNDFDNFLPVINQPETKPDPREKWRKLL